MNDQTIIARMEAKFRVLEDGCWEWFGAVTHDGYGRTWFEKQQIRAHRAMYAITRGAIPEGLTIDHLCGRSNCVNPYHLEAVTQAENNRRSFDQRGIRGGWTPPDSNGWRGRNNAIKTHCPKGHPYDAANTRVYRFRRYCRECERLRRYRIRNPEAAA